MSEFKRLLEDPSTDELEADLLRFARKEGPSASARAKIMAAVGAGVVAGGSMVAGTQSTSIAPTAAKSSALLKWLLAGTAVLVPAGIWLAVFSVDKPQQPLQPNQVTAPAAAPVAPAPAVTTPEPPVTKLEDLPVQKDATGSSAAPSLADEVKAIQRAKTALSGGNPSGALKELDAYRQEFPRGRLSQEATVLRIEALAASGNQAAAKKLGEQFLKNNEKSPYADRIKSVLGR
jgi:TolA-binding protein